MTGPGLKQLLDNVANTLVTMKFSLTPNVDDEIVKLLESLQSDPIIFDAVAAFVQSIMPDVTKDQLLKNINTTVGLINQFKQMETNGELDQVIGFCRNLENRPLVLTMLALLF